MHGRTILLEVTETFPFSKFRNEIRNNILLDFYGDSLCKKKGRLFAMKQCTKRQFSGDEDWFL